MQPADTFAVQPARHPDPTVARAGFNLDHPYLEQCWTPVLGPTAVSTLRRLTDRCRERAVTQVDLTTLAGEVGVRPALMRRTLNRLERFGFISPERDGTRDLYATVPPLPAHQLDRVPPTTRSEHRRLLGEHLDELARQTAAPVAQRLDRLQHHTTTLGTAAPGLAR